MFAAFSADRPDLKKVYDTANFHHFVHTLALLAVPLCRRPALVSPRMFLSKKEAWKNMQSLRYFSSYSFDTQFPFLVFSDWYSHDSRNLAVLWHYLLPRIDRAENVSEVHPLRRDHPHHGMAFHGIVKGQKFIYKIHLVATLSSVNQN